MKSNNTAISFTIQASRGTFNAPNSTSDLALSLANLRPTINGITIEDDSYTGSVWKNAAALAGKNFTATFDVKLKPPSALPAANAFVLGRLLQAAKFTEVRSATPIPASPEALGVGSDTTHAKLGVSAASVDDTYRALPLILSDNGSNYKQRLTAIRDYIGSTKMAELMELLASPPAANWQIPTYLAYIRDISSAEPPVLSSSMWMGGSRFDILDLGITGVSVPIPTSTTDQAQFPRVQFTVAGTIYDYVDEATPTIPAVGTPPLLKDADVWLDRKRIGTSEITVDLGLNSERPPNPNQIDGSDAPEITGGSASVNLNLQMYLKSVLPTLTMADAQLYHPFWAQWGNAPWNTVQVNVPDARLNYPNIDLSGGNIMQQTQLFIDVLDRNLAIVFPGAGT